MKGKWSLIKKAKLMLRVGLILSKNSVMITIRTLQASNLRRQRQKRDMVPGQECPNTKSTHSEL